MASFLGEIKRRKVLLVAAARTREQPLAGIRGTTT